MISRIVVTGASGFVGSTLLSQLRKNNYFVTGLSRRRIEGTTIIADYADAAVPEGAILVHLAQGRDASGSFGEEDIELCRILSNKPWRHIVYASSAVVYGDAEDYPRYPEEPVSAKSDYARTKLACEKIVSKVGGTCLRFANIYGPGMGANTVIADILRQIPGEGPLRLRDTLPVRDFLWVEDAARCIAAACQIMPEATLNAGSGCGIAVGDVARLALALANEDSRPVVGRGNSINASFLTLDISKTQSVLNWSPEVEISAGLFSLLSVKMNEE